ncbi:MAG: IncP-type conjugal transfer protein TraG [Alphaproteobacteria bacterium]|nr:IncP-type conjugal transfer protein TraG [Alphaproteobacteria bacterium]
MPNARQLLFQAGLSATLAIAALWAATQWAAAELGHQPALGPAWTTVLGLPLYAPWKIFPWWLTFEAQAPEVFNRAGMLAALGGILPALIAIGGAVQRAGSKAQATTYGSARWAEFSDIKAAGLFDEQGIVLGLYDERYLRHDGPEHVLAVAPTRSGKGVGLVVPTLLTWPGSAIIHDIKGENWELTAGWRARFSHCLLFDPTKPDSSKPGSSRFNPLLEVRRGTHEVRDVQNIADILVDPDGARERRDHWEKTAHALLTGAILHVLYAEEEKALNRVATFLADPGRSIERTLRIMLTTNHVGSAEAPEPHPVVASIARELLNKSENERSGVVSTAMSLLGLYRDPIIAAKTAASDWRIADLIDGERPVSLYLVVPPSDISRTRPLVRLILNQIARRLTESLPTRDRMQRDRDLLLMLDELPALGRLEFFETSLAFLAGYGVRCMLIAQSLNQIEKAYGTNNAILDNCHVRVAFAPNDERTAKRLSDALGTTTELRAQRNLAGHRLAPWLSRLAVAEQETPRALLTPGEAMQLPPDEALVMISGTPPIRARKLRYFTDHNLAKRCLPPPTRACPDRPATRPDDWTGVKRAVDYRLQLPWSDHVASGRRRRDRADDQEYMPLRDDWGDLDWSADFDADPGRDTGAGGGPGTGRDANDDISGI